MLALLMYGCEIREPDIKHPLHVSTRDYDLLSSYYRFMMNYGICFFLTDPEVTPDARMLGFVQKWVYDQL
jgi:hypothetical protein